MSVIPSMFLPLWLSLIVIFLIPFAVFLVFCFSGVDGFGNQNAFEFCIYLSFVNCFILCTIDTAFFFFTNNQPTLAFRDQFGEKIEFPLTVAFFFLGLLIIIVYFIGKIQAERGKLKKARTDELLDDILEIVLNYHIYEDSDLIDFTRIRFNNIFRRQYEQEALKKHCYTYDDAYKAVYDIFYDYLEGFNLEFLDDIPHIIKAYEITYSILQKKNLLDSEKETKAQQLMNRINKTN